MQFFHTPFPYEPCCVLSCMRRRSRVVVITLQAGFSFLIFHLATVMFMLIAMFVTKYPTSGWWHFLVCSLSLDASRLGIVISRYAQYWIFCRNPICRYVTTHLANNQYWFRYICMYFLPHTDCRDHQVSPVVDLHTVLLCMLLLCWPACKCRHKIQSLKRCNIHFLWKRRKVLELSLCKTCHIHLWQLLLNKTSKKHPT